LQSRCSNYALRACRAALEIHIGISDLAQEVSRRDGVELQLRIGLNSGQVITGEIGTAATGYTAIGEQVGLAQRMESVAQPGGVMLSASAARLVEMAAELDRTWDIPPDEFGHYCLLAQVECPLDTAGGSLVPNADRHVGQRNPRRLDR
jgi:class 3 adenylate cyclase